MEIDPQIKAQLLIFQQNEIDGYHNYKRLAKVIKDSANRKIIETIAEEELKHYKLWKRYTGVEVKTRKWLINFYHLMSRLFGFTFGIRLMEQGEDAGIKAYEPLKGKIPEVDIFIAEEQAHEQKMIEMLDEESLRYAGSVVLGLNDALVELTGTLAGLTLAFQNTQMIALSGLITGIAAALSMAASEYLSVRSEKSDKQPMKSAIYTGVAYIITVAILILPYLIFKNYYISLAVTLAAAVMVIAIFNYYISVARAEPFFKRFLSMAGISLGVAAISFVIGYLIRTIMGIDV